MISHISGTIRKRKESSLIIDVNGMSYEVLIPPVVMQSIDPASGVDVPIELTTFHYYQMDKSKAIPVLVGFANEIEKEFFEQFITVSGVGPKAACRALNQSFAVIADAIDRGDLTLLKKLPGIGERKAREIIAKLQGKVGKFGLIQDRSLKKGAVVHEDVKAEALSVLLQLQYKKHEAAEMVEKALDRNPKASTYEEILNEVYKAKAPHEKKGH